MKVFHAARQDIEIVWHRANLIPHPIFDTQVAAMVLGYGDCISYDQLVQRITGDTLDKSNRFTDWTRRPLTEAQLDYAVSDVTHLRDVYLKLLADLDRRGRTEWVSEEMDVLTSPDTYKLEPENAWQRLRTPRAQAEGTRGADRGRGLARARGASRATFRASACSRTIWSPISPCRRRPRSSASPACAHCRRGFERSKWGQEIPEVVKAGLARDPKTLPSLERSRAAPNGAAIVELLKVLLRMTAEQHGVAAKVIATVDDLEQIAADDDADVPALKGWRRELFGEKALALKTRPPGARARKRPRHGGRSEISRSSLSRA